MVCIYVTDAVVQEQKKAVFSASLGKFRVTCRQEVLRDAIVVGCYLFSLSMAVIIIPYHKGTVREKQQSYVNGMLGGGLFRAYPQVSLVK